MPTDRARWLHPSLSGLLIAGAVFTGSAAASLIVNPTNNALLLANTIAGAGITVTGVNTYTYGAEPAFGTFSNGLDSKVGIESGVVISSGNAVDAEGPYLSGNSTAHGTPGLPSLSQLLGGTPTFDAALLNFTFNIDTPGSLNFAFSVGSSECCGIRDAYSFLLDGEKTFVGSVSPPSTYAGYTPSYTSFTGGMALAPGDPRLGFGWISDVINVSFGNLGTGHHSLAIAISDGRDSIVDSALFVGPLTLGATIASPSTGVLFTFGLGLILLRSRRKRRLQSSSPE